MYCIVQPLTMTDSITIVIFFNLCFCSFLMVMLLIMTLQLTYFLSYRVMGGLCPGHVQPGSFLLLYFDGNRIPPVLLGIQKEKEAALWVRRHWASSRSEKLNLAWSESLRALQNQCKHAVVFKINPEANFSVYIVHTQKKFRLCIIIYKH